MPDAAIALCVPEAAAAPACPGASDADTVITALLRRPVAKSPRAPRLKPPPLHLPQAPPARLISLLPALLAYAPDALVPAHARAPALLACAPLALVPADARPPALRACAPDALVLADARPPALLACAPLALVRADTARASDARPCCRLSRALQHRRTFPVLTPVAAAALTLVHQSQTHLEVPVASHLQKVRG